MEISTPQPFERARVLLTVADGAASVEPTPAPVDVPVDPSLPPAPPVDRRAIELGRLRQYRQVLWWSLQSIAPADTAPSWDALRAGVPQLTDVPPLFWLRAAVQTAAEDEALEVPALIDCVKQVRTVAAGAVDLAERAQREKAVRLLQARRVAGVILAIVVSAAAVVFTLRLLTPADLAQGKPWTASSSWGTCQPELGKCGALVSRILFHTKDDASPWFQIDLQEPREFSSLTVVNRRDGDFKDRAVPLVVEVGDDGASWREVARQPDVFTAWKPKFEPQRARYVRLRVDRKSWLHLETVKVHP